MTESEFDVAVNLIIRTEKSIDFITNIMGINPSDQPQNSRLGKNIAPNVRSSLWSLSTRYKRQTDIGECIHAYIEQIPECLAKLSEVKKYGTCTLRISIVSLLGQMGFSLSHDDLLLLTQLDIPFEVSIFSYGYCIDDSGDI